MQKQYRISAGQLFSILFVNRSVIMLTHNTLLGGGENMVDNILSALLALVLNFVLILPLYFLHRRNPQENVLETGERLVGKPGAILLNVGRGTAVDGEALAAAVHSGQLSGAGLDVTDPEPLPPEHPLWAEPNVIITPHVTGGFSLPKTLDNIVDIFAHNLRRYAAGQPLDNQMDRRTQYASGARLQSTL